jgi:OB-fold nucleic acid binding domain
LREMEAELPDYVTAQVADLAEEADQTKVTLGGIVAGSRRVITRAGSTMLVATLEDLTGSVEVVVFPKVYEQTAPAWADDSIVLVSGRLDRRDEAPQILCEAVWSWDDAVRMGVAAFGAERDRMLAPRGRWDGQRNGRGVAERPQGVWGGSGGGQPIPVTPPAPVAVAVAEELGAPEAADEPPAPLDAVPLRTAPEGSAAGVSVAFGSGIAPDMLYPALEAVRETLRSRPGPLPVVVSMTGADWQVKLQERVAWDDRLGETVRRAAGVPVAVELRSAIPAA